MKKKLAAAGMFGGMLLACGSANDAAIEQLGICGTFLLCMAFLAVSMICAAQLGALATQKDEED